MDKSEFVLDDSIIYLNHAGVSPWPQRTAAAVEAFAAENARVGSRYYGAWVETEHALKAQLQRLINAASGDEIALLKNTSEALSVVAYGLSWKPGDNIVITSQEFPSNRIVWESLGKSGVETRAADLDGETSPEDAIISRIDRNTRLVSVSSVQYATGLRLDLEKSAPLAASTASCSAWTRSRAWAPSDSTYSPARPISSWPTDTNG